MDALYHLCCHLRRECQIFPVPITCIEWSASPLPTSIRRNARGVGITPGAFNHEFAAPLNRRIQVLTYGLNIFERWKLRHLPGPPPRLFIGNLLELRGRNSWDVYTAWTRKYGSVYRWFQGRQGMVTITRPDLVKEVLLTKFQTFHNREMPKIFGQLGHGPVKRFTANMVFAQ